MIWNCLRWRWPILAAGTLALAGCSGIDTSVPVSPAMLFLQTAPARTPVVPAAEVPRAPHLAQAH